MKLRSLSAIGGIFGLAVAGHAQLTLVTNRGAMQANDSIDWGQFGASFTTVNNGSMGMSQGANPFLVSSSNQLLRVDEAGGWNGNFTAGDRLMFSGFDPNHGTANGSIDMSFGRTVNAVGAQIQQNQFGSGTPVPFLATLTAYDGLGNNLGTVTEQGLSQFTEDGSAIFIGVHSSRYNIARVVFQVKQASTLGEGFAVNGVSIHACAVPEPTSLAVLGLGAIALIRRRRK